ncbi:YoaK family protein [Streptomyces sp. NPDC050560]|uniref:YoaK family protein n=1 Tax=Streptomyces sp. NPDC050560 TaxID=3365630 RepID=UPI0037B106F5
MPPSAPKPPPPAAPGAARERGGLGLTYVLLSLTVVSGVIDAVSYLGLGRVFTANMTGNVAVLGFAAAGAPGFSALHALVSLGAFFAGSAAGGRLARWYEGRKRRAWVRTSLTVEAALLGAATVVAAVAGDGSAGAEYTLIALTGVAMGLRNSTVQGLGVADLTTTVLTRTLSGLFSDAPLADPRRTLRRVGSVLALLAGAVLGAWLVVEHDLWVPLLIVTAVAAVMAATASGRE